MVRSKLKLFGLLLLILSLTVFVGCVNDDDEGDEGNDVEELTYASGTELKMGVAHNSKSTTITFEDPNIVGEGLKLADGKTYQLGDLKPVWAELEDTLDVKFNNVYTGASTAQKEYLAWKAKNFEGVDALVGNASDIVVDGRANKIVDLSIYLDKMPNFKAFLEQNPIVYLSLISDTTKGSIYYAPYFDGYDDIEKYFLMRTDWVELLLDGEGAFASTTSDTFGDICKDVSYSPYMPTTGSVVVKSLNKDGTATQDLKKNYETSIGNIIDYMNENVSEATTGVQLVNMLRDYIDTAYDGYYGNERSRLFTGYDACWDADELVALLRCVVTNTFALTGQNETKVTGLFPRETALNRTADLLSLSSMFGVRGSESRNDYLYFDKEGNVIDARGEEDFIGGINKLNQLYKEGLILQNFDTYATKAVAKTMYQNNLGFMLYDYCQTQTIYNEDKTTKEKCSDFNLSPVMNPVASWNDGTGAKYVRFTESWRSVKTNGWCIPATCTGDALNAALVMFDYMYSNEGRILMSYGPESWRSGNKITYKGQQIPELSEKALDELWSLAGGNYTNYARQYLGSTLPIGFIKDQGMEYQCTTEGGRTGAAKVSAAIAQGTLKHVSPELSDNLYYTMVPTVLPTTTGQDELLKQYAALQNTTGIYSKTKEQYNIYIDVIKFGLGSEAKLSSEIVTTIPASVEALVTLNNSIEIGGGTYEIIQASAWDKLYTYYQNKIKK